MNQITFIRANGKTATFYNVKKPELEALQAMVDGYIEVVPNWEQFNGVACVAYCDEEGMIDSLPVNDAATKFWRDDLARQGGEYSEDRATLYGDILILTGDKAFLS